MPYVNDRDKEVEMPLQKMRVHAYLYIPADASVEDAVIWLRNQCPELSREARTAIVQLHAEDEVLREWRIGRAS
jgi:hypothetical protein